MIVFSHNIPAELSHLICLLANSNFVAAASAKNVVLFQEWGGFEDRGPANNVVLFQAWGVLKGHGLRKERSSFPKVGGF